MKYGKESIWCTRRKSIRGTKQRKRHPSHSIFTSEGHRVEACFHLLPISLSDIGDCKISIYEQDYINRKPCFYIKAVNTSFKTCIELLDNKYIKEAAKNTLTDKQAEELYEFMCNTSIPHDIFYNPSDTVYEMILSQWWSCNYYNNTYKDLSSTLSIQEIFNRQVPDYRLLNGGTNNE